MRKRRDHAAIVLIGLLTFSVASCAGAPPPVPSPAALTDDNACPRYCAALERCGGAPHDCETGCRRDAGRLRRGFSASFVSCVELQLAGPSCGTGTGPASQSARGEHLRLCYYATVEAYAERDGGRAMGRVVTAVCKRRIRCQQGETTVSADDAAAARETCMTELQAHAKGAASKVLATADDDAVGKVSSCVEARPCSDDDPVGACFGGAELGSPGPGGDR